MQHDLRSAERKRLDERLKQLLQEYANQKQAFQALQDALACQGRLSSKLKAQRDALAFERRSLQQTLRALRAMHISQGTETARIQAQRDALLLERRVLQEALNSLRSQSAHYELLADQLRAERDAFDVDRKALQDALRSSEAKKHIEQSLPVIPLPAGRNSLSDSEKAQFDSNLESAMAEGGVSSLESLVENQIAGRSEKFSAFCQLRAATVALAKGHLDAALNIAQKALKCDPSIGTVRDAAHLYHDAAVLEQAYPLVNLLESMQESITSGDRRFIDEVRDQVQLVSWASQGAASRTIPEIKQRVLNVLAFSLPYSSVGYATRSHGLAQGIQHSGWDIRPYTRPCFPYDAKPELEGQVLPPQDEIDGLTYRRLFDFDRKGMNEAKYLHASITSLNGAITQEQPEIVHAASNYATALPALVAARRLGVPFVYEMRGFWEVTRSSRDEAFENTPKYRFMQLFDNLVAQQADHVVTITTAMKEELLARGIPEHKISIAYNSVDPVRFLPRPRHAELAHRLGIRDGVPVIGYVGSFVDYEGLDDLITAAAGLKSMGREFRLLLVGDGAAFEAIRTQVQSSGLEDKIILTGRVLHAEVEDYYSLVDIAPFPRKPWRVCELVSPLKPFEAMALEKVVVVSDTRALKEIIDHERTGFVFKKGDVDSLKDTLEMLIRTPDRCRTVGKAAREWILKERSWDRAGLVVSQAYQEALSRR
jgi:glycosyltransferase involved in cell wall biosynthesis